MTRRSVGRLPALAVACVLATAVACSADDTAEGSADDTAAEPGIRDDVPDGYVTVESGFVGYLMPESWGYDSNVPGDLNRHIGDHGSAPGVAAAETVVYLDFPSTDDTDLITALDFLATEFDVAEDARFSDVRPVDIPGAAEAERVDYDTDFGLPEFDSYQIADLAIRAPSGELAAVRVGAVTELVDDGTFDTIIDSIQVVE